MNRALSVLILLWAGTLASGISHATESDWPELEYDHGALGFAVYQGPIRLSENTRDLPKLVQEPVPHGQGTITVYRSSDRKEVVYEWSGTFTDPGVIPEVDGSKDLIPFWYADGRGTKRSYHPGGRQLSEVHEGRFRGNFFMYLDHRFSLSPGPNDSEKRTLFNADGAVTMEFTAPGSSFSFPNREGVFQKGTLITYRLIQGDRRSAEFSGCFTFQEKYLDDCRENERVGRKSEFKDYNGNILTTTWARGYSGHSGKIDYIEAKQVYDGNIDWIRGDFPGVRHGFEEREITDKPEWLVFFPHGSGVVEFHNRAAQFGNYRFGRADPNSSAVPWNSRMHDQICQTQDSSLLELTDGLSTLGESNKKYESIADAVKRVSCFVPKYGFIPWSIMAILPGENQKLFSSLATGGWSSSFGTKAKTWSNVRYEPTQTYPLAEFSKLFQPLNWRFLFGESLPTGLDVLDAVASAASESYSEEIRTEARTRLQLLRKPKPASTPAGRFGCELSRTCVCTDQGEGESVETVCVGK